MKFTKEQLDFFSAFAESVHKLPDKFIDTKLIVSILFIQMLLVGVCTLYLKVLVYELYFVPPIVLERTK